MQNSFKSKKNMFRIDENNEILNKKLVPPLKLCESPKISDKTIECSSLTFRLKRRNQIQRSLDFNLTKSIILTPKVVRADHTIIIDSAPRANTSRLPSLNTTITINNRRVSKNLFLDSFPS